MSTFFCLQESRRKLDDQIFKFETHYLEEASKISHLTKALKNPSRTLESLETDRLYRKNMNVIKPRDRIFSRSSFTSPLYDPSGPLHDELTSLREIDNISPVEERIPSPLQFGLTEVSKMGHRKVEKTVFDTSSEDEDYDGDGVDSVIDDAASEGTAHDDDDPAYDVDSMVDEDNEDSNASMFGTRRMSRHRIDSGSVSPSLTKRRMTTDSDYSIKSRRSALASKRVIRRR